MGAIEEHKPIEEIKEELVEVAEEPCEECEKETEAPETPEEKVEVLVEEAIEEHKHHKCDDCEEEAEHEFMADTTLASLECLCGDLGTNPNGLLTDDATGEVMTCANLERDMQTHGTQCSEMQLYLQQNPSDAFEFNANCCGGAARRLEDA